MSLYLTQISPKGNDNNPIERTQDKFINYIIQEESQFANLKSIEEQLLLSSKRLRDKIDKTNLIKQSKQKEIDGLISQINASVKQLYQFNLGIFTEVNLDDIIKQKRKLIQIKEHDYNVYRHMKTRLYNTNHLVISRIDTEMVYEKRTREQAFFYKVIHIKVSKDFNQQNQMYNSLSHKKKEDDKIYNKETQMKDKLFKSEQEKLKETKAAIAKEIKYVDQLVNRQKIMHNAINKTKQCNIIQYNECKTIQRDYYKNRMLLCMIIKALSTKELSNIIRIVNDKQKKHNEMFLEYIHLNSVINKDNDLNTKYDNIISDMRNEIAEKKQKQLMFCTEYSDLITQIKENKLNRMQFCNKQSEMETTTKEALVQTFIAFLIQKCKIFNDFNNNKGDNCHCNNSQLQTHINNKEILNYNSNDSNYSDYSLWFIRFINIFNVVSYNYFLMSFKTMKTILKDNNRSNTGNDININSNNIFIYYPNEDYSKTKLNCLNTNETQMRQLNKSAMNNNSNMPNKINKKNSIAKKTHSELMFGFKTYLKFHNNSTIYNYVTNFPKKSITNLSKYYSEANSEITSVSSIRNNKSSTKHLIGFSKRFAYDIKNKTLSNKKVFRAKKYLSNRSDHEINDDSYEISSNRQSPNQMRRECYSSKWPKEDSDQKRIKARMNDIYKMKVKANDKLTLKNTQELMEAYFKYETKKKNRCYHLQSAYSMKNLMSSGSYLDIKRPRILSKRYIIDTPNRFVNTNFNTNYVNSADNKEMQ